MPQLSSLGSQQSVQQSTAACTPASPGARTSPTPLPLPHHGHQCMPASAYPMWRLNLQSWTQTSTNAPGRSLESKIYLPQPYRTMHLVYSETPSPSCMCCQDLPKQWGQNQTGKERVPFTLVCVCVCVYIFLMHSHSHSSSSSASATSMVFTSTLCRDLTCEYPAGMIWPTRNKEKPAPSNARPAPDCN